ncbi:MAG: indolepyruvate ferredoxin oxidoreductase subunit alpha [Myxococcota bacterium]|jgi:indolepyruvate ferredoxin oxidoreductase alpha subunit
MSREVLTGNEAIARGAHEYGVVFASAYPGTPSTEILENIAKNYKDIYAEWSPNEKVAYEVAFGASMAGGRSLVTMKHVGVNVAADPLMTSAYIGVGAGMVLVSADDPSMHSSQNEQDNRRFAFFAKMPCIEPSDSQEAKDFVGEAYAISEKFDIPVMLRVTTRICHSKSIVELGEPMTAPYKEYQRDFVKFCMLPTSARVRRVDLERRLVALKEFSESYRFNKVEMRSADMGIITSGISYQHSRDAFPEASTLKIALSNPLPEKMIREFAGKVKKLYVVEELEPYMEDQIKAMGIECTGKSVIPNIGELTADLVRNAINGKKVVYTLPEIPARPPILCPGCSHRGFFTVANRMHLICLGDIGCYTLGAYEPLNGVDSCLCMGASVGKAVGFSKAYKGAKKGKVVGIIGDSTFVHSGITGLIDAVYNRANVVIAILDNGTTAMTGHQEHPGTGRTLMGQETHRLDLVKLCEAIGVPHVRVVNPNDLKETEKALKEELAFDGPSVIVFRAPCVIRDRKAQKKPLRVIADKCPSCGLCFKIGCPAIIKDAEGKAVIDPILCVGCDICAQVCRMDAIVTM